MLFPFPSLAAAVPSTYDSWRSPTALQSCLVYAYELWAFARCPVLRGSTVSYAGVAHVSKNCLEYSMNFWSQSKKKYQRVSSILVCPSQTNFCLLREIPWDLDTLVSTRVHFKDFPSLCVELVLHVHVAHRNGGYWQRAPIWDFVG